MNLSAKLEERMSQKSGKPYFCIVVRITDTYEKLVFLERAEVELIRATSATSGTKIKLSQP